MPTCRAVADALARGLGMALSPGDLALLPDKLNPDYQQGYSHVVWPSECGFGPWALPTGAHQQGGKPRVEFDLRKSMSTCEFYLRVTCRSWDKESVASALEGFSSHGAAVWDIGTSVVGGVVRRGGYTRGHVCPNHTRSTVAPMPYARPHCSSSVRAQTATVP
jgi:hypothetical protein